LDGQRLGIRQSPPQLGEHNVDILQALGYTEAQIKALTESAS